MYHGFRKGTVSSIMVSSIMVSSNNVDDYFVHVGGEECHNAPNCNGDCTNQQHLGELCKGCGILLT